MLVKRLSSGYPKKESFSCPLNWKGCQPLHYWDSSNHSPRVSLPSSPTFYFKLPYIGLFSVVTQKRVRHLIKRYCNDLDIKLVFSSFKIGTLFGVKDLIPGGLRSRVVYKFACAGCNACYVGETTRHFSTRVREHLVSDRASHIFKHLENSEHCHDLCSVDCFHILDHASTTFQLKIKEAFHIRREQPSLNQQLHQTRKSEIIFVIFTFPRFVYIPLLLM